MDSLEKMLEGVDLMSGYDSFEEKLLAGIKDFENGNYRNADVMINELRDKYVNSRE